MNYVIRHPRFGYYTEHERIPRFRRKKGLHKVKSFTLAEAQAFLKDRKANPGMEDCTVEPESK